ncbi:hypothetical protein [Phenylobacterium sp.]|uniref:hypothetical protein n=1 Tax=Phenylobacterium sp. TaxID=1871053 RepID=UPI003564BFE1
MVALSDRKIEIVRTLVESAPDKIVGGLQRALAETSGDTVLTSVRLLVEAEARDRMLRNGVFLPVTPLFVGDGSDKNSLVFPARALACIWRGLKVLAPEEIAAAGDAADAVVKAISIDRRPPDTSEIFDGLVELTAHALRTSDLRDFRAAVELCDRARPGGAEALAACLDISPVVRRAVARLPDWVTHTNDDTSAAARLAYKDSVAVAEDAGPRFFEMLAGHLTPPWMVLRVISAVMDKPTERYLADSELGGFPERVMSNIDETLKAIGHLDADGGPKAGRAAAGLVTLVTEQIFELEVSIELNRETGWGQRILGQKQSLAAVVEARLRDAEKLATAALPMQSSGFSRMRKTWPKLDTPPDPKVIGRATTLLTFAHELRHCANHGGFSATHAKVGEQLGGMIDHYVEEVLDHVRTGDAPDLALAHSYLKVAANFDGLVRDEKAAELIRRRAAAVCLAEPPADDDA